MNVTEIGTKKSRKHCSHNGYCQRDSEEHEGYDRVLTDKRITENNNTDADSRVDGLLEGKYRPKPVRRVEIPKDNGKKRQLGIPTVVDRMVQQAMQQVLTPIYDPTLVKLVMDSDLDEVATMH